MSLAITFNLGRHSGFKRLAFRDTTAILIVEMTGIPIFDLLETDAYFVIDNLTHNEYWLICGTLTLVLLSLDLSL